MRASVASEVPARPLGRAVVAVGMFDGVHLGHRALLDRTVQLARERGVLSAVATFDTDPEHVLRPEAFVPQLLDLEDRLRRIDATGVDVVLVLPFDRDLADRTAEEFLDTILMPAFPPERLVVGSDFRLGRGGSCDTKRLVELSRERGVTVEPHDLIVVDGAPVSATRIRGLIAEGRVREAALLLGRPHACKGLVVQGRGSGRGLGAPTANMDIDPDIAVPADGVYACVACIGESQGRPAAVSVGPAPSYDDAKAGIEAHILDFEGDLYGRALRVGFIERLRDQHRFDDEEALAEAIAADVERVRELVPADGDCASLYRL
jgi:riboflavin kinase/FMN adenylyltransferase